MHDLLFDLISKVELRPQLSPKQGRGGYQTGPRSHPISSNCYHTIALGGTMEELDRITRNPAVMGGKACIRGMRVTVGMIVGQIAEGATPEQLLAEFPYIEREDITQALRYAAWLASEREVLLASA